MLQLTLVVVGSLKEAYWRDAFAEYEKRLGAFCKLRVVEIKEQKLPDAPSDAEVKAALAAEGHAILSAIPQKAYKIALCVEGERFTSEAFADKFEKAAAASGQVALVIGSSYGLSDEVKSASALRLSVSDMTFPHQLMRVLLLEILYRSFQIGKGTRYHK